MNIYNISKNMDTEKTYQSEFEEKLTDEFEGLIEQIYDVKRRAEAYCEQEDASDYFKRTVQCMNWVCDNYAFAPYEE